MAATVGTAVLARGSRMASSSARVAYVNMVTQRCMYNTFIEQNLYYYGLSGLHTVHQILLKVFQLSYKKNRFSVHIIRMFPRTARPIQPIEKNTFPPLLLFPLSSSVVGAGVSSTHLVTFTLVSSSIASPTLQSSHSLQKHSAPPRVR